MDYKQIIENNYELKIKSIRLFEKHFGTEIYLITTVQDRYIAKKLPIYVENVKNEGRIADFLSNGGIKVARFKKAKNGDYFISTENYILTIQEFIDGETFKVNTAPDWFMEESAKLLGKTNRLLSKYGELSKSLREEFFCSSTATKKKLHYENEFAKVKDEIDDATSLQWKEQIAHLGRCESINIDTNKLTYTNSHGDYHIGQAIVKDKVVTIIDWTSACCLPVCLDVITSYVFASPSCIDGAIDSNGLKKYIKYYTEYFPLSEYDIKMMPYVLYFWQCICNYTPGENIPDSYKPIADLITRFLNWLHDNVDELSEALQKN